MDTPSHFILLAMAAFGAGVLNAVAGGGTFLTFPALVFVGVPPIMANATSALAVCPGYLGGILGFRSELRALEPGLLRREILLSAIGGLCGAGLLLVTPARIFSGLVPWLLLFATALFAFGPQLARRLGHSVALPAGAGHYGTIRWRDAGLLAVAVYGGYFNGGLGILLMALYTVAGESRLNTVNGLKNLNSSVLSVLSVAAFAWAGSIVWTLGVLMMATATVGGFAGARMSRRLPIEWVRNIVIVTGLTMSALFFLRSH